jgi:hypothetical protein
MKKLKIALDEGNGLSVVVPIPQENVEEIKALIWKWGTTHDGVDFQIIESNVEVITWTRDIPVDAMSAMAAKVPTDSLFVTDISLGIEEVSMGIYCPQSMEDMVESGRFREIWKEIKGEYEALYWDGTNLAVYNKGGRTEWKP